MINIGSVLTDNLDLLAKAAISERFGERSNERSEGPTEFGNPATVTQPVHQSAFPTGQQRNTENAFSKVNPLFFVVGGAVLLLLIVVLIKVIR